MDTYTKIAQAVKAIVGSQKASLFTATVKSVDDTVCTVDVGGMELTDVRLRSVVNNDQGRILATPKVGSTVLVGDLSNGAFTDLAVLRFAEVDKVEITIGDSSITIESGKIEMNGGNNNGLINIADLTEKLNALVDWCANHTHSGVITAVSGGSGAPAVGKSGNTATSTSQPQKFEKSNYEDTTITH